jgi:diphosphomevalonate decarboxylase
MEVTSSWRSPSNIALVKYWGKHVEQLPNNASMSMTLTKAFTETVLVGKKKQVADENIELCLLFEGSPEPKFSAKIVRLFDSLRGYFPFIADFAWHIESKNSFPHSTGIASSASSMSALALCLCSVDQQLLGNLEDHEFLQKASLVSRLGSGSACRSVYPGFAVWGEHKSVPGSSNEYAVPLPNDIHSIFSNMRDAILMVSSAEKSVSSRAGHALMEKNPFAEIRYEQANKHTGLLLETMIAGDLPAFGNIVEKEALTLHSLMMMSEPSFLLMRPNTLQIIEEVRRWRQETGAGLFFTLDAGPNVHLLYPDTDEVAVENFIRERLLIYCEDGGWIKDELGSGPYKIN